MLKKTCAIMMALIIITTTHAAWAQPGRHDDTEPTYTVQFNDSDILEVIKFVAEITGKTMVIDPRVKGRIKIMSSDALTEKELFALFRSVLEISDYTVVEVGDIVRILPLKDARTAPTSVNKTTPADDSEFITQVIQLKNIDAAKVIPVLRPLVPQNSHLAAYPPSNAILITDTRANIDRVNEVIEKIDRAAMPETEIVQLKYANASDMVSIMEKLEGPEAKQRHSSNNLNMVPDERNNAIILSGEEIKRIKAKQLIRQLDQPQKQAGNVRVVYLEYAEAKEVATVLSKVVQNMAKLTPGQTKGSPEEKATVEADEATNALLITAQGDMLNSLLSVVHRLDIRRAQVLVEAIIVELTGDDAGQLGIEWLFANENKGTFGGSSRGQGSPLGLAGSLLPGAGGEGDSGISGLAQGLANNQGQILGLAGLNGDDKFSVILSAARTNSRANILSTPSLMTMDNQEATISVGQNVPFRTGSFSGAGNSGNVNNPFTTIQREDVGVTLTVTPQVNEGDKILLDISQEVSSLQAEGVEGSADLITNQSTITTQILASDNQVIVLGGLIKDEVQDGERRVPLLGSVPVLGNFFKVQSTSHTKSNLMVFLRAKIIRDDETMYGATAEKYRYIQGVQQIHKDKGLRLLDNEKLQVLPDLEERILEQAEEELAKKEKEREQKQNSDEEAAEEVDSE